MSSPDVRCRLLKSRINDLGSRFLSRRGWQWRSKAIKLGQYLGVPCMIINSSLQRSLKAIL